MGNFRGVLLIKCFAGMFCFAFQVPGETTQEGGSFQTFANVPSYHKTKLATGFDVELVWVRKSTFTKRTSATFSF